jgi:SRSO17 transposase
MTKDQVQAFGPAFAAFLQPFERFFDTLKTVRHFRTYTRGLLSDLPRKTAEPIAKQSGTPPRNLQQFLKACLWDHAGLTDAVQRTLRAAVADLPADPVGTVAILDETSAVKKGDKTPGVQRQYLGCVGKVENGIVTVHLAVAHGRFKALLTANCSCPSRGTPTASVAGKPTSRTAFAIDRNGGSGRNCSPEPKRTAGSSIG